MHVWVNAGRTTSAKINGTQTVEVRIRVKALHTRTLGAHVETYCVCISG